MPISGLKCNSGEGSRVGLWLYLFIYFYDKFLREIQQNVRFVMVVCTFIKSGYSISVYTYHMIFCNLKHFLCYLKHVINVKKALLERKKGRTSLPSIMVLRTTVWLLLAAPGEVITLIATQFVPKRRHIHVYSHHW